MILGVVVYVWMTDTPAQAHWLEPAERTWLETTLAQEQRVKQTSSPKGTAAVFLHGPTLLLAFSKFCVLLAFFGVTLWLPQIVRGLGTLSNVETGFVTALPYLCAAIGSVLVGRSSDRSGERALHIALPAFVGALGFLAASITNNPYLAMTALCVATTGLWISNTVFWTLPTAILAGTPAAAGLALINSVGNLGRLFRAVLHRLDQGQHRQLCSGIGHAGRIPGPQRRHRPNYRPRDRTPRRGLGRSGPMSAVIMPRRTVLAAAAGLVAGGSAHAAARLPRGVCDTHVHVLDPERFPFSPRRRYTPGSATVARLREWHDRLHIDRVVVVQNSVYGSDHACLLDALQQLGLPRARGVATIGDSTTADEIAALDRAGVRGTRLNLEVGRDRNLAGAEALLRGAAARMPPHWHVHINAALPVIAGLAASIQALPGPVVLDHFAHIETEGGPRQDGADAVVALLQSGKAYVKLSGPYQISRQPDYAGHRPDRADAGGGRTRPGHVGQRLAAYRRAGRPRTRRWRSSSRFGPKTMP